MKLLVTGGSGFIGSHLIKLLLADSQNHSILNIDCLTYASNNSLEFLNSSSRYQHEEVDICSEEDVNRILSQFKPDCIMHLAAESHVDNSIKGPGKFVTTNILGTFNLLNCSLSYVKKENINQFRFHHVSTDEVYGDLTKEEHPFRESNAYKPSSPYSATKAASDHLVRAWGRTYGLPVVITNCSNNYGPYQDDEKLIPTIIKKALQYKKIPIYGDGSQIRDWLFVEDHARALYEVAINGKLGETYNIGGLNELKNINVAKMICSLLDEISPPKKSQVLSYAELIEFVDDRPGHDTRYAIDCSKIQKNLGWEPKESFESGLKKTVKWYVEDYLDNI
tara:strand:+ start:830 stop:1837 length:1008 start_codon:yes stop_codon:yes gene_type:complete